MPFQTKDSDSMSIVHKWLDTEGKDIDEAFGKPPASPPNEDSDVALEKPQSDQKEYNSGVLDESEGLREALIDYQKLAIDPRLNLDVDKCTWEDVFAYMTRAEEEYEQKSKGWRGVGHRLLRKAGDHAEDVDPWLKLIPPEYGMGIVGAGISIIFMLARNASRNRERILEAFGEIPIILASAKAKLLAFPDNQELKSCNKSLHLEIILSVSSLVGALLPESHAKKVPYFWSKSKLSKSTVDDVLKSLQDRSDELKRLVQDIIDQAIGEVERTTRDIKEDTSSLKTTASQIQRNTTDLRAATSGLRNDISTLISKTSEIGNDSERRLRIYEKRTLEAEKARNSMTETLKEVIVESDQEKDRLRAEIQYLRARTPVSSLMTAKQFIAAIGASTLIHQSTDDIDKVLRLQGLIHPISEAEAVSLIRSDTFRAWLQSARSDTMLIDSAVAAVEAFDQPERVSAKSVLCASLLANLGQSQQDAFQLFFFVGLHSSEYDLSGDGPRGMIRSLLCELVKETHRRGWLSLDFIDNKIYRDGIQNQNIEYMCDAFYKILQRLKMQDAIDLPIYCVIDGIGRYEQQRWYNDLAIVIQMFQRIVTDNTLMPTFKLLMTGPHRIRYIQNWFGLPPVKRISTNAVVPGESLGILVGPASGVKELLQAKRQPHLSNSRGFTQYLDDIEAIENDYE